MVADGKITQEQAAKLREQWKQAQDQTGLVELVRPLLQIREEAKFDAALAKLVADGKMTFDQAAKVKEQWRKRWGNY